VWLIVFSIVKVVFAPVLLNHAAGYMGIAVTHSVFNILCTALLLPQAGLLEKMVNILVPDAKTPETASVLDERLLDVPAVALERCRSVAEEMGRCAVKTLHDAIASLSCYSSALAEAVREGEDRTDHYEDVLGSYLVKLSSRQIGSEESAEAAMLLKVIGDFERISDHSVNIVESAEELQEKGLVFSEKAAAELNVLTSAVNEILDLSLEAFCMKKMNERVEPLEQVIDELKEQLRFNHIQRMQRGECTIDVGFVWTDLLTNLERTSDHCSNVAGCVLDLQKHDMNMHENLRVLKKTGENFKKLMEQYTEKYALY